MVLLLLLKYSILFALFCLTELKEWWSGCIIFPSNSVLTTDCDELVASSSSFYSVCTPPVQCTMYFLKEHSRFENIFYQSSYNHKGGLISESFSIWLKSHKNLPNHYPEQLLFRWIVLKIVIWHFFWEIWTKLKIFPRLSHL